MVFIESFNVLVIVLINDSVFIPKTAAPSQLQPAVQWEVGGGGELVCSQLPLFHCPVHFLPHSLVAVSDSTSNGQMDGRRRHKWLSRNTVVGLWLLLPKADSMLTLPLYKNASCVWCFSWNHWGSPSLGTSPVLILRTREKHFLPAATPQLCPSFPCHLLHSDTPEK